MKTLHFSHRMYYSIAAKLPSVSLLGLATCFIVSVQGMVLLFKFTEVNGSCSNSVKTTIFFTK